MNSNSQPLSSPPLPALAFRVGVVGHRPNRLESSDLDVLGSLIREMLDAIKKEVLSFREYSLFDYLKENKIYDPKAYQNKKDIRFFSDEKPVLRALSPLAEGTDRIFAEQALTNGYELCCVMPFTKNEYEKDFLPDKALESNSLSRFNDLLSKAKTRFELDGSREDVGAAYGAAGEVVLNQSDLLIVVWDGERHGMPGGTEETLDEAMRMGVEVIWISANAPHYWKFIDKESQQMEKGKSIELPPDGSHSIEEIRTKIKEALVVPYIQKKETDPSSQKKFNSQGEHLIYFYSEKKPDWRIAGFIWKFFRDLLGNNKLTLSPLRDKPFETSVLSEWPSDTSTAIPKLVNALRPFYAWIDKLAVIYSDKYHSAFVSIFFLAALSVGLALLPICFNLDNHPHLEIYSIGAEFILILTILIIYGIGRNWRWHERWLDYRIGAELIRHLRFISPLGGKRPYPQTPAHWTTYGQISSSWMSWYVRAIERMLGLPDTIVDRDYLEKCIFHIRESIDGQITFHKSTSERCNKIRNRLHRGGIWLLILTLVACFIHLMHALSIHGPLPEFLTPQLLIFITGFFPALGAALAAINNQGEFRRIDKRSKAMSARLKQLLDRVEELQVEFNKTPVSGGIQFSTKVTPIVSETAGLFVNEVLDWRVVFQDQPLKT